MLLDNTSPSLFLLFCGSLLITAPTLLSAKKEWFATFSINLTEIQRKRSRVYSS